MNKQFQISVIMAVYKVEEFLRESVRSLEEQDIGFENIQLILVDDGSPDHSGAICDQIAKEHPDNVLVLHKPNGGVSSARNLGLEYVQGAYVNFLDSDDKLTKETCSNVYRFFEAHKEETDVVSVPLFFFDGAEGSHTLNYKYEDGTRLIDLTAEWDKPQLSSSSCFFRAEALENLRFDKRLAYAEDAQLVQKILLNKRTMGVVKEAGYLYRRRSVGEQSAIQSSAKKPGYYLPYMKYFGGELFRLCLERYGEVPRFVQFCVMYDLQWRIQAKKIPQGVLTPQEETEYIDRLYGLLDHIDDEVISAQRNIWIEQKLHLLRKKHGSDVQLGYEDGDISLMCGEQKLFSVSQTGYKWEFLKIQSGSCTLEGRLFHVAPEIGAYTLEAEYCGKRYPCTLRKVAGGTVALGEEILDLIGFRLELPLARRGEVKLLIRCGETTIPLSHVRYGKFFPLNIRYPHNYYAENGYIAKIVDGELRIERAGFLKHAVHELKFLKDLLLEKSGNRHVRRAAQKAVIIRPIVALLRLLKRKPLWLVSDRITRADDNGIAFFLYMRREHPEIDARFVVSKSCADFQEAQKYGPVLNTNSFWHKVNSLRADFIVSSMAEEEVYNPFEGHSEPYRDLLRGQKFVFLQHGIIKDDLSDWLDRYKKNIFGFVTSVYPEYDSVVNGDYNYPQENIWLTGLPRYDRLVDAGEKQITIMPTWRKYLMTSFDRDTGTWRLGADFAESTYCQFYNALLNDERLLSASKRLGYRIAFLPHPNLQDHMDVFQNNPDVLFLDRHAVYREIYAKSGLVVTDYSSAVFDFAYIRKPIVYTHFDQQEFFAGEHVYTKGYFEYERDGLGEVEYDLDGTVNRIISYMENGCQLKEKYRDRIDRFFPFHDQKNSERVYQKIMEMNQ